MFKNIFMFLLGVVICIIVYRLNYIHSDMYNKYHLIVKDAGIDAFFDEKSTLDDGLEIHDVSFKSGMPLVISGHSGKGKSIYFNNLNSANIGSKISIEYKGEKMEYEVVEKDYIQKFSDLGIPEDDNYLYLVTCDQNDIEKQLIVVAKKTKIA